MIIQKIHFSVSCKALCLLLVGLLISMESFFAMKTVSLTTSVFISFFAKASRSFTRSLSVTVETRIVSPCSFSRIVIVVTSMTVSWTSTAIESIKESFASDEILFVSVVSVLSVILLLLTHALSDRTIMAIRTIVNPLYCIS